MRTFGIYDLEYDKQRYCGNVRLVEHHSFKLHGVNYVFNVATHAASVVRPNLARLLASLGSRCNPLVPGKAVDQLRRSGLLVDGDASPQETGADVVVGPGEAFPVVRAALFLAQECNMRCVYCYGQGGKYAGSGLMPEPVALGAIDWLMHASHRATEVTVGFFGGEPLMNRRVLKRTVAYAKSEAERLGKKVCFSITTNGTLLTDNTVTFLKNEDIKTYVSFDGPAEYHDRQRPLAGRKGSHSIVQNNVRRMRSRRMRVSARATLWEGVEPTRVISAIKDAGFSSYSVVKASPVVLGSKGRGDRKATKQASRSVLDYYRAAASDLLDAIRARRVDEACVPDLLHALLELANGRKRDYSCGAGKGMMAISATGDIYPCHRFVGLRRFRLGNVMDNTTVGDGDYWRATVDASPTCRRCWARYLCGGGCLYHNLALSGDILQPGKSYCDETRALFEELIHVLCSLTDGDRAYLRSLASSGASAESRRT